MKMQRKDFLSLQAAIHNRFTPNDLRAIAARYEARGLSRKRFRWDMLLASGFDTTRLYMAGLYDENIDTALRHVIGMDGDELLQRIKAMPEHSEPKL